MRTLRRCFVILLLSAISPAWASDGSGPGWWVVRDDQGLYSFVLRGKGGVLLLRGDRWTAGMRGLLAKKEPKAKKPALPSRFITEVVGIANRLRTTIQDKKMAGAIHIGQYQGGQKFYIVRNYGHSGRTFDGIKSRAAAIAQLMKYGAEAPVRVAFPIEPGTFELRRQEVLVAGGNRLKFHAWDLLGKHGESLCSSFARFVGEGEYGLPGLSYLKYKSHLSASRVIRSLRTRSLDFQLAPGGVGPKGPRSFPRVVDGTSLICTTQSPPENADAQKQLQEIRRLIKDHPATIVP